MKAVYIGVSTYMKKKNLDLVRGRVMKRDGRVRGDESSAELRVWSMGKDKKLSWRRVKGNTRAGKDKSLAEMCVYEEKVELVSRRE